MEMMNKGDGRDTRSKLQIQQQQLWQLLGQVTAAQRWNIGMISSLKKNKFETDYLVLAHQIFVNNLNSIEKEIRKKMKSLKSTT